MRNFNESTITAAPLQQVLQGDDKRAHWISQSLTCQCYDFVRDIKPIRGRVGQTTRDNVIEARMSAFFFDIVPSDAV
jgi:hypothetical protein